MENLKFTNSSVIQISYFNSTNVRNTGKVEHVEYTCTNQNTLMTIISCFCVAAAATIFYKKTFKKDMLPLTLLFILLGISLDRSNEQNSRVSPFISFGLFWSVVIFCVGQQKWMRTLTKDFFIPFFITVLDYKFDMLSRILDALMWNNSYFKSSVFDWACILIVVLPQFIRKPASLKAKLQGIRSKLGPIYILYCAKFVLQYNSYDSLLWTIIGMTALLTAILAGIIFRPDNVALLELLEYKSKLSERRYLHGRAMILSFVCTVSMCLHDILNYNNILSDKM